MVFSMRTEGATVSQGSPPPCGVRGERSSLSRSGVGVSPGGTARVDPPPRPSPARGEGAHRTCRGMFATAAEARGTEARGTEARGTL
jgi:hypothetical protein